MELLRALLSSGVGRWGVVVLGSPDPLRPAWTPPGRGLAVSDFFLLNIPVLLVPGLLATGLSQSVTAL